MGAVLAAALLAPLVLDRPDTPHRFLGNTTMVTLGRWSYGLFIWHLAALAMVFPVIGEFPFNGHMPVVLVLTVVFGFAIAAVSYALGRVALPSCVAALGVSQQRPMQAPPPDSAIRDVPEPVGDSRVVGMPVDRRHNGAGSTIGSLGEPGCRGTLYAAMRSQADLGEHRGVGGDLGAFRCQLGEPDVVRL